MTPGSPVCLVCPHCGQHKYIESINSGNTCIAYVWSDTKHEYPMLPYPSSVQYCPHCGQCYFYEDAKRIPTMLEWPYKKGDSAIAKEAGENGFGELSFKQADLAYEQLYTETLSAEKQNDLLFHWLFTYNDEYGGRENPREEKRRPFLERVGEIINPEKNPSLPQPPKEILQKHNLIVNTMIERHQNNELFVAELYREQEDYDKSIELAEKIIQKKDGQSQIAQQILDHARRKDRHIFLIMF